MGVDYYELLNVNKNVSDDDPKVAFGKLALRWNLDENLNNTTEAEGKFKQIAEAYVVLHDPQKRAVYDQFGEEGFKGGSNAFVPGNALEIFVEFNDKPPIGLGSSGHTDFGSTSRSHNDAPITRKSSSFEKKMALQP